MNLPDELLTVFSAEIDEENGSPVVSVPDRELEIGNLDNGETYRVAVLTQPENDSSFDRQESAPARQESRGGSVRPVEEGDRIEVEIEDIGDQGDGIARVGPGYIIFVSNTDIGDRVTIEVTQARENYAFADVVEGEPTKL